MQVGAELYGHGGPASDLEIIRLMLEMMAVAGVERVHLDLGHVGIYRHLAGLAGLDQAQEAALFEILQRKDRTELQCFIAELVLPAEIAEMLLALMDLNGGEKVLEIARQHLVAAGESVGAALAELETLWNSLRGHFPSLPIHFDLTELRGYHYQTGVVFAAFTPNYGREIARGGRYDDIGKAFGRARPATGFSADLKVLARLSVLVEEGCNEAIFAPALEDADLETAVRDLRSQGRCVIRELTGQSGGARVMGCGHVLRRREGEWIVSPVEEV
jgi:ATP phosphoribosyltransferase regulatory subunit